LAGAEVFGRRLRIDYSDQRNGRDAGRRDPGSEGPMETPPQQETFQGDSDPSEGNVSKPDGSY